MGLKVHLFLIHRQVEIVCRFRSLVINMHPCVWRLVNGVKMTYINNSKPTRLISVASIEQEEIAAADNSDTTKVVFFLSYKSHILVVLCLIWIFFSSFFAAWVLQFDVGITFLYPPSFSFMFHCTSSNTNPEAKNIACLHQYVKTAQMTTLCFPNDKTANKSKIKCVVHIITWQMYQRFAAVY